jgi:YidC/Oxa1 family membrane protein insertase
MFIDYIYIPIYNLLTFFVDVIPGGDLGLAVIAVTIAVRFIFLPISLSAAKTQEAMKEIQPELVEIKDKYKKDPQQQAKAMMALYKEKNVKPFSSMLLMFIQIPVLFGLFFVAKDVALYSIDPSLLYAFVPAPEVLSALFLGTFPVASPSLVLALFAGLTQYAYAHYSVPVPPKKPVSESSMQDEFGRAMALQMRFLFPFIITFVAFASGALALYLAAGNVFMFAQQIFVKRSLAKSKALAV